MHWRITIHFHRTKNEQLDSFLGLRDISVVLLVWGMGDALIKIVRGDAIVCDVALRFRRLNRSTRVSFPVIEKAFHPARYGTD